LFSIESTGERVLSNNMNSVDGRSSTRCTNTRLDARGARWQHFAPSEYAEDESKVRDPSSLVMLRINPGIVDAAVCFRFVEAIA
jgi:hypothetical protein